MSADKCTWEGCDAFGGFLRKGKDGRQWANLCKQHDEETDAAITAGNVKKILSNWVKAQGGSKKAAERM